MTATKMYKRKVLLLNNNQAISH